MIVFLPLELKNLSLKLHLYVLSFTIAVCFSQLGFSQWTVVGDSYESTPTTHESIAINSLGQPYVAFKDGSVFGKTSVITLENDVWVNVGEPGFSIDGLFGTEHHALIFDDNDVPFLIFRDLNDDSKPSVMTFNGSEWEYVGEPSFIPSPVSDTDITMTSDGTLYVVFREAGQADKVSVMTFDGSEWVYVGEQGFSTWDSQAGYITIASDPADELYISLQEEAYGDGSSVMTWNGSAWEYVGEPGFSEGGASFQSLVIDDAGNLFVAFRDQFNDNKCSVMTWNGSDWEYVGAAGFSPGSVSYTSLIIDSQNRLSVTYRDWANSSRTSVMSFIDGTWMEIGMAGFSSSSANHQDIAVNENGHIWVAYEAGDVEVQRFVIMGCNDVFACNYDPTATDDDGSCVTIEVFEIDGVTNPQAGTTEVYAYEETVGSTYEWVVVNGMIISGQGTSTIEVEWVDIGEGLITIVETNSVGCESEPVVLEVTVPVGILDAIDVEFNVFPNPVSDNLTISWPLRIGSITITLFNAQGQLIFRHTSENGYWTEPMNGIPAGNYRLLIENSELSITKSIMVEK